ncbi:MULTISPECIES: hypothetical protein [unclassified Calothrix]|uniref:hypothetical protein n=2 Tax=Calothrix TaxID=1186 RepID=UPI0018EF9F11|nr:hypothetical protein [Calothrix sp. FACHB-1219]
MNFKKEHGIMEQELLHQHIATVTDKKKDPNYGLVRGLVPQDLLKRFKIYCVENGVDNSQGLENLLREYFELKDQEGKESK